MNIAVEDPNVKPIRLLIVSDYAYPSGGVEHFIQQFILAVSTRFDCRLLSWSSNTLVPLGFENLTAIDCGDIRQAWSLMDWADVLFVPISFNVRMLARLTTEYITYNSKPTVTVVQTSSHSNPQASSIIIQNQWLAELITRSSHTVVVSSDVLEALRALSLTDEQINQVTVIENAARLSPVRSTSTKLVKRQQVSFIGRPYPQKGFDLYVRLAHELHETGLTFAANTVGVPLQEPIEGIKLSTVLSDDELVAFFEQTDLLVVPYLYADGLSLAVLEALNCGVPIIGFDSPGVGQLLRRYSQKVIAPNYSELRRTVENWYAGRLPLTPPIPGTVVSWADTFGRYVGIIESIGESAVE